VILEVEEKISKNNVAYCTITVEDSSSQNIKVVMWNDDFKIFKDDLKKGNFVRMRVIPPNNGFRSLTFYSPSKRDRHKLVPKNRADDLRLIVLRKLQDTSEVDLNSFKIEG
jgi:DNA polymerase III alpha subunit